MLIGLAFVNGPILAVWVRAGWPKGKYLLISCCKRHDPNVTSNFCWHKSKVIIVFLDQYKWEKQTFLYIQIILCVAELSVTLYILILYVYFPHSDILHEVERNNIRCKSRAWGSAGEASGTWSECLLWRVLLLKQDISSKIMESSLLN